MGTRHAFLLPEDSLKVKMAPNGAKTIVQLFTFAATPQRRGSPAPGAHSEQARRHSALLSRLIACRMNLRCGVLLSNSVRDDIAGRFGDAETSRVHLRRASVGHQLSRPGAKPPLRPRSGWRT